MSIAYLLVALGPGVFALTVWALFWVIDDGQGRPSPWTIRRPVDPCPASAGRCIAAI